MTNIFNTHLKKIGSKLTQEWASDQGGGILPYYVSLMGNKFNEKELRSIVCIK